MLTFVVGGVPHPMVAAHPELLFELLDTKFKVMHPLALTTVPGLVAENVPMEEAAVLFPA
jgi:hypothetical protein